MKLLCFQLVFCLKLPCEFPQVCMVNLWLVWTRGERGLWVGWGLGFTTLFADKKQRNIPALICWTSTRNGFYQPSFNSVLGISCNFLATSFVFVSMMIYLFWNIAFVVVSFLFYGFNIIWSIILFHKILIHTSKIKRNFTQFSQIMKTWFCSQVWKPEAKNEL